MYLEVSRVFKESVKCVSRKIQKKVVKGVSNIFQKVLFCDLFVAWLLSQLTVQKEGLFLKILEHKV